MRPHIKVTKSAFVPFGNSIITVPHTFLRRRADPFFFTPSLFEAAMFRVKIHGSV